MPAPREHQQQPQELNRALRSLERFLADPQLPAAVDATHDEPALREEAAPDAAAFFRARGVFVPDAIEVMLVPGNWRFGGCVRVVVNHTAYEIGAHDDSRSGWGWGCGWTGPSHVPCT